MDLTALLTPGTKMNSGILLSRFFWSRLMRLFQVLRIFAGIEPGALKLLLRVTGYCKPLRHPGRELRGTKSFEPRKGREKSDTKVIFPTSAKTKSDT